VCFFIERFGPWSCLDFGLPGGAVMTATEAALVNFSFFNQLPGFFNLGIAAMNILFTLYDGQYFGDSRRVMNRVNFFII